MLADQEAADKTCKSVIILCVADSHLEYVKGKGTAFNMWESLENTFRRIIEKCKKALFYLS